MNLIQIYSRLIRDQLLLPLYHYLFFNIGGQLCIQHRNAMNWPARCSFCLFWHLIYDYIHCCLVACLWGHGMHALTTSSWYQEWPGVNAVRSHSRGNHTRQKYNGLHDVEEVLNNLNRSIKYIIPHMPCTVWYNITTFGQYVIWCCMDIAYEKNTVDELKRHSGRAIG